jgi:hypothetical protein
MDLDAVCVAIAANITAAELTVAGHGLTATPFAPDALTAPHFFTAEFTGEYKKSFNSLMEMTLTCRLMLARADDRSGQQQIRRLASTGESTIAAAFDSMRGAPGQSALSGACDDLYLRRVQGPRLFTIGAEQYYGLEFTVFVMG